MEYRCFGDIARSVFLTFFLPTRLMTGTSNQSKYQIPVSSASIALTLVSLLVSYCPLVYLFLFRKKINKGRLELISLIALILEYLILVILYFVSFTFENNASLLVPPFLVLFGICHSQSDFYLRESLVNLFVAIFLSILLIWNQSQDWLVMFLCIASYQIVVNVDKLIAFFQITAKITPSSQKLPTHVKNHKSNARTHAINKQIPDIKISIDGEDSASNQPSSGPTFAPPTITVDDTDEKNYEKKTFAIIDEEDDSSPNDAEDGDVSEDDQSSNLGNPLDKSTSSEHIGSTEKAPVSSDTTTDIDHKPNQHGRRSSFKDSDLSAKENNAEGKDRVDEKRRDSTPRRYSVQDKYGIADRRPSLIGGLDSRRSSVQVRELHSFASNSSIRSRTVLIDDNEKHTVSSIIMSDLNQGSRGQKLIDQLLKQTDDENMKKTLYKLSEIMSNFEVDHDALGDRQVKKVLNMEMDRELKSYMVSEFTKNNNNNVEDGSNISDSRQSLARPRSIKDSSVSDDSQDDSTIFQTLSKLPTNMVQKYKLVEPYIDDTINSWDFEAYRVEEHPLLYLSIWIFEKTDLLNVFNFDPLLFNNFMLAIEKSYRMENAYHNMYHATDVLQAVYYLANLDSVTMTFSDLDLLSLFFAASVHDVDHPGLNNNFLVTTDNPLAILYNNRSVLENHHVSFAFRVHEEFPVWSQLSRGMFRKFRDWSIELVLATDFSQHFGIMGEFKSRMSLHKPSTATNKEISDMKLIILKMIMKCADVSNASRSLTIYVDWAKRICEEFFKQGDTEHRLDLPVSAFMDRRTTQIHKSQSGFIEYIAKPLFASFHEFYGIPFIMDNLNSNKKHWDTIGERQILSFIGTIRAMSVAHKMIKRNRKRRSDALGSMLPSLTKRPSFHENVDYRSFMQRMRSFDIERTGDIGSQKRFPPENNSGPSSTAVDKNATKDETSTIEDVSLNSLNKVKENGDEL